MSEEVSKTNMEHVTEADFRAAIQSFDTDKNLVHWPQGLQPRTPFDSALPPFGPNGEHQYNLTSLWNLTSKATVEAVKRIKTVAVGCMDWRQAHKVYQLITDGGYQPGDIFLWTVGGGIIQHGGRILQAQTIFNFLAQHCQPEFVVATGHVGRCGALASFLNSPEGKLSPLLGEEIGGKEEKDITQQLIIGGCYDLLPPSWRAVTRAQLITPEVDGESRRVICQTDRVNLPADWDNFQPLRVADLVSR